MNIRMPSGIPAHARTPAGVRRVAALAATFLFAVPLSGCEKVKGMIGRGGANLSRTPVAGESLSYRSLIEAPAPDGGAGTRIELTLSCKTLKDEGDGWSAMEGEVGTGRYEVNGAPRQVPIAGQKATFKYNALRKVSGWRGPDFPTALELLDLAPPKGRVKKGEAWKTEARRTLINLQEEVEFARHFVLEGESPVGSEPAWRMSVRVPPVKKTLAAGGALLEFSGSGEIWVAKKDGRLLKATELLEGKVTDEKSGKPAARFAQAMTLVDAATGPAVIPPLAVPPAAPPAVAAAPAAAAGAAPALSAPSATGTKAAAAPAPAGATARLSFVSRATGRREVWSVLPDGSAKRCLTPLEHEHWNHAPDPDGRMLAVVSARPDGVNVWSMNLVTGDRVPLTQFAERDPIATGWASGGGSGSPKLVFARAGKLWAINRDGFNLVSHPLGGKVVGMATAPATSLVAVVINELNQNKLFTVDILSGVIHELFEGEAPAFSPDGQRLAYRTSDALFVMNSDGSGNTQIMKGRFSEGPIFWHPKGGKLGVTQAVAGSHDVYVLDASPNPAPARVTKQGGSGVAFSPAGDRVAYLRHGDLWLASLDGATHSQLTADGSTEEPVWWAVQHVP